MFQTLVDCTVHSNTSNQILKLQQMAGYSFRSTSMLMPLSISVYCYGEIEWQIISVSASMHHPAQFAVQVHTDLAERQGKTGTENNPQKHKARADSKCKTQ